MTKELRALIVEDSQDDALLLVGALEQGGYEPRFERVDSSGTMAAALARQRWDIVFADYTMPQFRGTDALELLTKSGLDVPFIFVSGTIGEDTAVAAMKAGAHDYIMKGNLKRLVPAVQRELREAETRHQQRQVEEKIRRQQERVRALHQIDLAIISTLELHSVLKLLLEKLDLFLPDFVASAVRLLDKEHGVLELAACRCIEGQEWISKEWKAGAELDRVAAETKTALLVEDLQTDPRIRDFEFTRRHGLGSYLAVPLIAKREFVGVLSFYLQRGRAFNNEEIEFLVTLGGQAALAIHNAQLYEQTKKQAEELEQANRVKSEFLSVMSHELKTPLNIVMGYAGMIRDKIMADQGSALEKIVRQSRDLLEMIDGILDVTAIEAGAISLRAQEFRLDHFLEEMKSLYDYALGRKIRLVWEWPAGLPKINTDSVKLKHILQNLINNALKFTEEGTVTVSARITEGNRQQAIGNRKEGSEATEDLTNASCLLPNASQVVEFKVTDTGPGIPEDKIPVIFERFRQLDSSTKRSYGGTGIGLHIVKTFTEMMGGWIEVESELGKGSTFTVTIPLET
ncbi:MAG: hybrid sensor histidine kinase/response regulator [Deltaproteobacteria bacterium]|nr:hybrid sensor histidine kinase/response regulator [Deltaproteobacteria bacterium]